MKKLVIAFLFVASIGANAQKTDDSHLRSRLQEYLFYTKQLDVVKLMDFMHPKLFTIVPRAQLIQSMQQAFNNKQMKLGFDSMAVMAISPVYKVGNTSYRKIDYYAGMHLTFNDSLNMKNKALASQIQASFQKSLPGKTISLDAERNAVNIVGNDVMFAIKDPSTKDWMFLGYDRTNKQLAAALLPKQVLQYFKIQ